MLPILKVHNDDKKLMKVGVKCQSYENEISSTPPGNVMTDETSVLKLDTRLSYQPIIIPSLYTSPHSPIIIH